ncbi:MAG TPA: YajQ family cyclic di-GMP-binding protein [Elusimicrobia bacterium]|nr:MAG: YajQ family cyclic di-GMP-binding protein [Elusimicrobia bacterium GWA2_66_18]OGR68948.1 MAG: YajQ family cyclic di-GMP-binding protein [Elusimicrobia bacterium GWC2_65_9]HAZ07578.1 YajQ family cyclic di-GMP-binding protein [Elusimicrobiota bacterium]
MAGDFSFDAVSDMDLNLVSEAAATAMKEIVNRFDLKTAGASIELDSKAKKLTVRACDEFKVEQAYDVLLSRMAKRGLALKNLKKGTVTAALGQTARLEIAIESGIPTDKAKKIQQALKDAKLKVNAQIQEGQLRVSSKSKDELQAAMALLRNGAGTWELDLQFKNFR